MKLAAFALGLMALVVAASMHQPAHSGFCESFPAVCDDF